MFDYLTIDVATSIFAKDNPYSQRNKMCLLGIKEPSGVSHIFNIEYSEKGYRDELEQIQELLNRTKLIVAFNWKFDGAWLRRYGLDYSHCRIFDCQLFDFITSGQVNTYPSLNKVAEVFGIEQKFDEVGKLWEQGIDTPDIPYPILSEYLEQNLVVTEQVYIAQMEKLHSLSREMQRLLSLSNQDLLVLLEMEWNGLVLDFDNMKVTSIEVQQQVEKLKGKIDDYFGSVPSMFRNYSSGDCLSCLLYGGTLLETKRTVIGVYKTGAKTGQPRFKIDYQEHVLPRRFVPPKGSELKKEGFFATNEEVLRSIKGNKEERLIIDMLLSMSKLEKLDSTYYHGLAKLHEEKDWEEGVIHGQFNMCVARTGRLSSSAPNLQNLPSEMDQMTVSRF